MSAAIVGSGRRAASLAISVAGLWLGGCHGHAPPSQFPDGAAALARMKATYACANGVQGEGKLDHFSDQGRVRGEVLMFAINPDRVRIDVLSPFGAMVYSLTSNGKDFHMLDFQQKQFMHGPASACNLARMTQVPVPGHVLVSLLRGEAPLLVHPNTTPTIVWQDGHYLVGIQSTRDASQQILLQPYDSDFEKPWQQQRVRVVGVTTSQRGVVLYRAELRNHQAAHTAPARVDEDGIDADIPPSGPACDAEVPRSIRVTVPHNGDDVIFQYQDVAFNPPIVEGAFHQDQPAGTTKIYVDCKDD